jgi:hypothetical protein
MPRPLRAITEVLLPHWPVGKDGAFDPSRSGVQYVVDRSAGARAVF